MLLTLKVGQQITRENGLGQLVDMLYERKRHRVRARQVPVRGDVVEVQPANWDEEAVRIEFFGDEIDRLTRFDPLTGNAIDQLTTITIYPGKQFVTPFDKLQRAQVTIPG
jgi:excinuclease ABC subunit B